MFTRALRHFRNRRRPIVASAVALVLVAAPLVVSPSAASAAATTSLAGSPFNGTDGINDVGSAYGVTDVTSGPSDDSYTQGAKEDDPCPVVETGSIPNNKADLTHFYVKSAPGTGTAAHDFLYLAWDRASTNGTVTLDFELNRSNEIKTAVQGCNGVNPTRTVGDKLITYDLQGNHGAMTVVITVRNWTATGWDNGATLGASSAEGSISSDLLFGEMVIDLEAAGIFTAGACTNFANVFLKSRSSNELTAEMKDFIAPHPESVVNCGSVTVHKVDDLGRALSGAEFTLYNDNGGAIGSAVSPAKTCTTADDGYCTIDDVRFGTYWLKETKGVGGHAAPAPLSQKVVVAPGGNTPAAALEFVDPRLPAEVAIHKTDGDGADLNGALFELYTDNAGAPGTPVGGTLPDTGACTTAGMGDCTISALVDDGHYWVVETGTPLGYQTAPAKPVDLGPGAELTGKAGLTFVDVKKQPGLSITKQVNGHDTTAETPLMVEAGAPLTYTVVVTNTGALPLTIDSLTDNRYADLPGTCHGDPALGAGERITCTYITSAPDPGTSPLVIDNTAAVSAHDDVFDQPLSGSDDAWVDVLKPAIELTKSASPAKHVGETVDYTMTATNAGNIELHDVGLPSDALCDPGTLHETSGGTVLAVGASATWECSHVVTGGDADPLVNTAGVSGKDTLGTEVSDTATASTDILHPSINVTKTGDAEAHVGDTIHYTIVVTNTGDTPLTNVALTDNGCHGLPTVDPDAVLGAEEPWAFECTHIVVSGDGDQYLNTVSVSGQDDLGEKVTAGDSWPTDILKPAISVTKTGPAQVQVGGTATYTIVVMNTGNTPLDPITVKDPKCDADPVSADGNGALAAGQSRTYTCSRVILDGDGNQILNTATADGTDALDLTVHGTANFPSDVLRPAIAVTKDGPSNVHVGDAVVYTIVVTNPGNAPLGDVTVSDPKCDGVPVQAGTDADGLLSPGETWTFHCTHVATAGDGASIVNTVTVGGTDDLGQIVTNTASHTVGVLHPAITIDKSASPDSISGGSGTVTYAYVVTNTGDTTLFNVLVTDDILGPIGTVATLAPGQSITMNKTVDVDTSTPPTNIGTATGTDVLGEAVTANDSATISVVLGEQLTRPEPAPAQELPRTGAPLEAETKAALALIEVGLLLELSGRRRRRTRRRAG